jgi:hypothetical protein
VNKRFRVCSLDQQFLLPPSLQDWLPEDHLARFVADVMNELDLFPIYAKYERSDGRGLSAYHPLLLTRLLLYVHTVNSRLPDMWLRDSSSCGNGKTPNRLKPVGREANILERSDS